LNPNTDKPFSQQEMQERFDLIASHKIVEIDIWRTGIPDDWWPFIENFVNNNNL